MRKRICIVFGHLEPSNGISRSAIAMSEILSNNGFDVTLAPLFAIREEAVKTISSGVHIQRVLGFYFRGLPKLVDLIPDRFLYKWILSKKKYDLEIGFEKALSIKIIAAADSRSHASKLAWMHGYDEGLELRTQYETIGKVICVSKCNALRLANELPTISTDYCYNPINEKFIVEQGKADIDIVRPKGVLFVTVGRLSPEKGYIRLLDIVAKLKSDGYKLNLWIIGDGPEGQKLKAYCNDLNINEIVTFTGAKANPHRYTSKSDVFVCSSFSEGYSTACTEAAMLGVPIVTTDVSGSKEIIDDCEAGLHCGLDNESLYSALKKVLDNPKIIDDWKRVMARTKEKFSQEHRTQRLLEIVSNALK